MTDLTCHSKLDNHVHRQHINAINNLVIPKIRDYYRRRRGVGAQACWENNDGTTSKGGEFSTSRLLWIGEDNRQRKLCRCQVGYPHHNEIQGKKPYLAWCIAYIWFDWLLKWNQEKFTFTRAKICWWRRMRYLELKRKVVSYWRLVSLVL
jgi:hypothetical protein